MNDIFKNWMSTLRGSRAPVASNAVATVNLHFGSPWYQRHNQRRQEHLASLQLDLVSKSVLEVGAGVGDHTFYFLDRDCTVVSARHIVPDVSYGPAGSRSAGRDWPSYAGFRAGHARHNTPPERRPSHRTRREPGTSRADPR